MKVAIIGGGVIGLSTAWELSARGHDVTLIDQGEFGRKASWAGAGILLPGNAETSHPSDGTFGSRQQRLHETWSKELLDLTGVDNVLSKVWRALRRKTAGEIATLAGSIGYGQNGT